MIFIFLAFLACIYMGAQADTGIFSKIAFLIVLFIIFGYIMFVVYWIYKPEKMPEWVKSETKPKAKMSEAELKWILSLPVLLCILMIYGSYFLGLPIEDITLLSAGMTPLFTSVVVFYFLKDVKNSKSGQGTEAPDVLFNKKRKLVIFLISNAIIHIAFMLAAFRFGASKSDLLFIFCCSAGVVIFFSFAWMKGDRKNGSISKIK